MIDLAKSFAIIFAIGYMLLACVAALLFCDGDVRRFEAAVAQSVAFGVAAVGSGVLAALLGGGQ